MYLIILNQFKIVKNKLSLYLINLGKKRIVCFLTQKEIISPLLSRLEFHFSLFMLALPGLVTATYTTKWCLCTSRCFNKTHYLVGSHFIDG